jgi:hypothetical protein
MLLRKVLRINRLASDEFMEAQFHSPFSADILCVVVGSQVTRPFVLEERLTYCGTFHIKESKLWHVVITFFPNGIISIWKSNLQSLGIP